MTLTIVTICLNSEATIERCITSVIQNCKGHDEEIEYLILDGDSTDRTYRIARQLSNGFPYIRLFSEPDDGIYDAYNKGIKQARGEYIWFVNSDDELCDNAVDTVMKYIMKQPKELIHCFSVRRIDTEKGISRTHLRSRDSAIRKFSPVCHTPGIVFPVTVFNRLGLFDTSFKICSDFKLLQAALMSSSFSNHDECVINMYLGGISSDSRFEYMKAREQIRVVRTTPHKAASKILPILAICVKYLRNRYVNPLVIRLRMAANAN